MQKITPHLWFDKEAKEAAEFYASLLPDSQVTNIITLHDTPSGDCDLVSFVQIQSLRLISCQVEDKRGGRCDMGTTLFRRERFDAT